MKKLRFIVFLILTLSPIAVKASEEAFKELDSYVERRPEFMAKKQASIDRLKDELRHASSAEQQLQVIDRLFEAYYTFRFDSSMVYVNRGLALAESVKNADFIANFRIHRGLLLATSGYYSQAEAVLQSIDPQTLPTHLLFKYYYSMSWLYNFWSAYCDDREFAPRFRQLRYTYLCQALQHTPRGGAMYNYLLGEALFYRNEQQHAIDSYKRVLTQVGIDDRLYASAAYAIARGYKLMGRMDLYEQYIAKAGISDQVCPLKENLALQELSLYLYEQNPKNSGRAVKYIYCSMEDAQFYNNRLRMLEISRILPKVVQAYQDQLNERTQMLRWVLGGVSVSALLLLGFIVLTIKQNAKLNRRRLQMRAQNELLEKLNRQLSETNNRRETYLRLFLDLSAIYINKLDNTRKLVMRSIKAGKTDELLSKINRLRVQEEEANTFYDRFDRAFLLLYPDFVAQLNSLLREDAQIRPISSHSLTTELRIFALMRLGVTASQEIATLLFYSTQTIYNYKSAMKSRAKVRDTFEQDVNKLCHIIEA